MVAATTDNPQEIEDLSTGVAREAEKSAETIPLLFKIIAGIVFFYMLLPAFIVVASGLNAGNYLTFPPQGLSLRWIVNFLTTETFRNAYLLSMGLGGFSALASTILGTMVALVLSRYRFPGRTALQAFFLSPLLLPGVVLGLALYTYYLMLPIGLSRTLWGLMVGHVLVTMPFVIGTVSAALHNFDVSLEDAARSLGASAFGAFWRVTMRILSSSITAAFLFSFIVSFGQFEMSLFLSTPNLTPLPIAMYISLRYKFDPTAAAAGTFAIILVVVSMLITSRLTNLSKIGGIKFM